MKMNSIVERARLPGRATHKFCQELADEIERLQLKVEELLQEKAELELELEVASERA